MLHRIFLRNKINSDCRHPCILNLSFYSYGTLLLNQVRGRTAEKCLETLWFVGLSCSAKWMMDALLTPHSFGAGSLYALDVVAGIFLIRSRPVSFSFLPRMTFTWNGAIEATYLGDCRGLHSISNWTPKLKKEKKRKRKLNWMIGESSILVHRIFVTLGSRTGPPFFPLISSPALALLPPSHFHFTWVAPNRVSNSLRSAPNFEQPHYRPWRRLMEMV